MISNYKLHLPFSQSSNMMKSKRSKSKYNPFSVRRNVYLEKMITNRKLIYISIITFAKGGKKYTSTADILRCRGGEFAYLSICMNIRSVRIAAMCRDRSIDNIYHCLLLLLCLSCNTMLARSPCRKASFITVYCAFVCYLFLS